MDQLSRPRHVVYFSSARSGPLIDMSRLPITDVIVGFLVPDANSDLVGDGGAFNNNLKGAVASLKRSGKNVLIAVGGGGAWTTSQWKRLAADPQQLAQQIVDKFVVPYGFSGVDIDFEDEKGFTGAYDGVAFLSKLTLSLHQLLPAGQNIISHAPQTPFWDPRWPYTGSSVKSPYYQIHKQAGHVISWYNNQFNSNAGYDDDSAKKRVWYAKLADMVGAPKVLMGLSLSDRNNGYVSGHVADLAAGLIQPLRTTYPATNPDAAFGGVMMWQFSLDPSGVWANGIATALGMNGTSPPVPEV